MTRTSYLLLLIPASLAGAGEGPGIGCGCDPSVGGVEDADGDGYGSTIDCDDGDPAVHPGADEHCDGVDEDCDEVVDEDPVDGDPWYQDLDGDGFGDDTISESACDAPEGFVATSGDCDDLDREVHPGAFDACCDGLDADCDGEDDPSCSGDLGLVSAEAYSRVGDVVVGLGDLDGDGFDDLVFTAQGNAESSGQRRTWFLSGADTLDREGVQDLGAVARPLPDLDPGVGASFVALGDIDGDGFDDAALGAPESDRGGVTEGGAVLIAYGPVDVASEADWQGASLVCSTTGTHAGSALAMLGDLTGDGLPDLAVGADYYHASAWRQGAVFLVSGTPEGPVDLADAAALVEGETSEQWVGQHIAAAGDLDGDGLDELLAGYQGEDLGWAIAVISGPLDGLRTIGDFDVHISSDHDYTTLGQSLAGAGDVDQDGHDDILVADHGRTVVGRGSGKAYLFFGPLTASVDAEEAPVTFTGRMDTERLGYSLAGGLDMNADGWLDVAVGAPSSEGCQESAGRTAVWLGPFEGSLVHDDAALVVSGTTRTEQLGFAVASAGDMNGDGLDDLAVGAIWSEVRAEDGGAVWLTFGWTD